MRTALTFLSLIFIVAGLSGCASDDVFKQPPPAAVAGTWAQKDTGVSLVFQDNNRFTLNTGGEDSQRLTGWVYYPASGQASFEFDSRLDMCAGSTGVYSYERKGDSLTLTLVQDDCKERTSLLPGTWTPRNAGWF